MLLLSPTTKCHCWLQDAPSRELCESCKCSLFTLCLGYVLVTLRCSYLSLSPGSIPKEAITDERLNRATAMQEVTHSWRVDVTISINKPQIICFHQQGSVLFIPSQLWNLRPVQDGRPLLQLLIEEAGELLNSVRG